MDAYFYDMDGSKLTTDQYIAKSKADPNWRKVAVTKVGDREVSTVLLGVDHGFGGGAPIIFETMVFPNLEPMERYCTREEAIIGHANMVADLEAEDRGGR